MIAKTIKYTDYNGNEREEKFLFNLTKAELSEMELSFEGGLQTKIQNIIEANNNAEIIKMLKEIILKSYGEKTEDGKRFRKINQNGEPLSVAFSETEAYSQLFMELASNDKAASEFIIGILPQDMNKDELKKQVEVEQAKLLNNN